MGQEYSVELWARSFPSGMTIEVTVGQWLTEAITPHTPLGTTTMSRYKPFQPRQRSHILGARWTRITAKIPQAARPTISNAPVTLNLLATAGGEADPFPAGSVWVDDVSVVCTAGCAPPDSQ